MTYYLGHHLRVQGVGYYLMTEAEDVDPCFPAEAVGHYLLNEI